jgi:hypothetical protein
MNDHPELVVELHEHVDGVCDLSTASPSTRESDPWDCCSGLRCRAVLVPQALKCSCSMCSGRSWQRREERSRRTRERAFAAAAAGGLREDDLETLENRLIHRRW